MSSFLNFENNEKPLKNRIKEANDLLDKQIQELRLEIFLLKNGIEINDIF